MHVSTLFFSFSHRFILTLLINQDHVYHTRIFNHQAHSTQHNTHTPHATHTHTHTHEHIPTSLLPHFHSTKMHEGSRRPINRLERRGVEEDEYKIFTL